MNKQLDSKETETKPESYTFQLCGVDLVEIDIWEIFRMGVDYGQLIMEQERQGEGMFDAFMGTVFDEKYAMPMAQTQTRQVHSEKWFEAKEKSFDNFQKLYARLKGNDKFKVSVPNDT